MTIKQKWMASGAILAAIVITSCGNDGQTDSVANTDANVAAPQERNGSEEAQMNLGVFTHQHDIGDTAIGGSARYDEATDTYAITASGENMWGTEDAFHYVWKEVDAENIFFSADISFEGEGVHEHRKAGLMIRESLEPDAAYVDAIVHGDGLISMQYRDGKGSETNQIVQSMQNISKVRLEKEDDVFYMSVAGDDGVWKAGGGNFRMKMEGKLYVGLAVCSHDNSVTETALFKDVSLTTPEMAKVTETGYPAGVDSTLEILDVQTGNRTVVYTSDDKFEAPNWTHDGQHLLFNGGGKIWKIPVEGGEPVQINTGPYERNNNDHGISPDGTELIISDQSEPDDISRIYKLPIEGSDNPELIVSHPTDRSYWHAWHPDGDLIAYTARRPEVSDAYNIWGKRLSGGAEFRITDSDGLDDGPEFTPDGEWMYFNSTRTGAMQIWKVRPDGSEPTQVTFEEEYRDWFPHFSPDGKWMAMISFGLDVDLADHPPNRRVWLRMMPADESEPPHIVTKLFGGQGTINVPSWSPDSTRVAFVSYRLDRDDRPE